MNLKKMCAPIKASNLTYRLKKKMYKSCLRILTGTILLNQKFKKNR